jgi:hypothetical protein
MVLPVVDKADDFFCECFTGFRFWNVGGGFAAGAEEAFSLRRVSASLPQFVGPIL